MSDGRALAGETAGSPAPTTSAEVGDRASAFRAVSGNAETVNGGALLLAAYAFVWIVVMIVVARIFVRQTAAAEKLDGLEAELKRATSAKGAR
jgi:hypothetical protein